MSHALTEPQRNLRGGCVDKETCFTRHISNPKQIKSEQKMTQANNSSVANVYVQQERDDNAVRVTESEIAALDSERVKQIVEFSDDEIRMLKMKDLSTSVISNRDNGTLTGC